MYDNSLDFKEFSTVFKNSKTIKKFEATATVTDVPASIDVDSIEDFCDGRRVRILWNYNGECTTIRPTKGTDIIGVNFAGSRKDLAVILKHYFRWSDADIVDNLTGGKLHPLSKVSTAREIRAPKNFIGKSKTSIDDIFEGSFREGDHVRLKGVPIGDEFPDGLPEETGVIEDVQDGDMFTILLDDQYLDGDDDDGIRECDISQIELISRGKLKGKSAATLNYQLYNKKLPNNQRN